MVLWFMVSWFYDFMVLWLMVLWFMVSLFRGWIHPGQRGDSSIYANKGSAFTGRKRETTTKTAETACLTAANTTKRQGETILEGYCASGNRSNSFFVTEGGN